VSSHQLNSKNSGLALLLKTISGHSNCFLSSVAAAGKVHWKWIEVFMLCLQKSPKILWLALPEKNSFYIFLMGLEEYFVYELRH